MNSWIEEFLESIEKKGRALTRDQKDDLIVLLETALQALSKYSDAEKHRDHPKFGRLSEIFILLITEALEWALEDCGDPTLWPKTLFTRITDRVLKRTVVEWLKELVRPGYTWWPTIPEPGKRTPECSPPPLDQ